MYFIDPGQSITPFNPATNYSSMNAARETQLVFGYAQVEGAKRFVINAPAYIPEGYITKGQIGAVGFGQIEDSNGQPVTTVAGKLLVQNIDVDNLSVAEAATFYGDAQSGNFETGVSGWRLLQSGVLEANNIWARGRIDGTLITGSTIKGSVIEGSAFVALTEFGSPYVGLTSNLAWSDSGGKTTGWRYSNYVNIYSGNYSDTSEYRRYRRSNIDAVLTVSDEASHSIVHLEVRIQVFEGTNLVIDTGYRSSTGYWSGTGWSMEGKKGTYEYCGTNCSGSYCETREGKGAVVFRLNNYYFNGNSKLRFRVYTAYSASYSVSTSAINDY